MGITAEKLRMLRSSRAFSILFKYPTEQAAQVEHDAYKTPFCKSIKRFYFNQWEHFRSFDNDKEITIFCVISVSVLSSHSHGFYIQQTSYLLLLKLPKSEIRNVPNGRMCTSITFPIITSCLVEG